MNVHQTPAQEAALLVVAIVTWFMLVVPRYILALQLRIIIQTRSRAEQLAAWNSRVFESHCLVWATVTGLVSGIFMPTLSEWTVLAGSISGMILIGFASTLAAYRMDSEQNIFQQPSRLGIFIFAGFTLFWASAIIMRWTLNPEKRPEWTDLTDILAIAAVLVSVASGVLSIWSILRKQATAGPS